MAVIAHLSDIHIDDERSIARTRTVMDYLEALPHDLDAIVVTGDIADHGLLAEYEQARALLRSRHPVLVCPGNHDERAAFRQGLLGQPGSTAPINQVRRAAGFSIILCDSSIPGKDEGFIEDETLVWLEDVLAQSPSDAPVVIGFHHPPVLLHAPFVDNVRQFGEQRLAAVVDRHPQVAAFLCGHAHTAATTTFAGRPLVAAPGVVSTLRLPWEHYAHPMEHVHLGLPPGLAFHVLDEAGRLTTHYRSVASYGPDLDRAGATSG